LGFPIQYRHPNEKSAICNNERKVRSILLLAFARMGRQIRFYLCSTMRSAIETEARRIGATLVGSCGFGTDAIQFSTSSGTNTHEGRLWTEASDPARYELLCRAVKKGSAYDRESGLWVKRVSRPEFDAYRAQEKRELEELVERNRKFMIEVLGGRPAKNEG
jgi:hypothetical protein